jgi:deazaflavin-dependent oxidoreductase (nitroreductase family)
MSEPQYLYLITTGRKSGLPREIEIWFTAREGRFYLIAEHRERANWVQNIRRDPRITVRVGDRRFAGRGRVLEEAAEPDLWQAIRALSDRKYGWSDGLIVELEPDGLLNEAR